MNELKVFSFIFIFIRYGYIRVVGSIEITIMANLDTTQKLHMSLTLFILVSMVISHYLSSGLAFFCQLAEHEWSIFTFYVYLGWLVVTAK